jgi:hypothetical protein
MRVAQSAAFDVMPESIRNCSSTVTTVAATILTASVKQTVCDRRGNCVDGQDEAGCRELTTWL